MRAGLLAIGLGLVAAAGCGEDSVALTFEEPANSASWDVSCVDHVEVYTEGPNYPADSADYIGIAHDISASHPKTYDDVKAAIAGQFDVAIPHDGLGGIEVYGWHGQPGWTNPTPSPELAFFARVLYTGQDPIAIPIVPNISCAHQSVTVRPVDLLAYVTNSYDCTKAGVTDADAGVVKLGTLSPSLYKTYLFYWGDLYRQSVAGGVATLSGSTTVGPESCFALSTGDATSASISCVTSGHGLCTAAATELESVIVDQEYATNSLDQTILATFKGVVIGGVFDGTKHPVTGATITVDPTLAKVVYVDVDATGRKFKPTGGTATSASGLFMLYTSALVDAKVQAAGATRTVQLGATNVLVGGAAIVMN